VAAYDPGTKRHSLHMIEPSGVCYEYYGAAAGRGRQPARTEMEKLAINPSKVPEGGSLITVSEGVRQLAKIVHALHDDAKDKPFELEMSWLCEGSGWRHEGVPRDAISEAVEWAKREIDEDADDNDEEEGGDDDGEDDEMEE
jgi:20S proteasome subunit alpha 7